jgi:hypothetical protein
MGLNLITLLQFTTSHYRLSFTYLKIRMDVWSDKVSNVRPAPACLLCTSASDFSRFKTFCWLKRLVSEVKINNKQHG